MCVQKCRECQRPICIRISCGNVKYDLSLVRVANPIWNSCHAPMEGDCACEWKQRHCCSLRTAPPLPPLWAWTDEELAARRAGLTLCLTALLAGASLPSLLLSWGLKCFVMDFFFPNWHVVFGEFKEHKGKKQQTLMAVFWFCFFLNREVVLRNWNFVAEK